MDTMKTQGESKLSLLSYSPSTSCDSSLKSSKSSSENELLCILDLIADENKPMRKAFDESSRTNNYNMACGPHSINFSFLSSHLNEDFPKSAPSYDQNTPDSEISMAITTSDHEMLISHESSRTNNNMVFGSHLMNLSSFSSHLNEAFLKSAPSYDQNIPDSEIPMAITANEILVYDESSRINNNMVFVPHLINFSSFSTHLNSEAFPKPTPSNDQNSSNYGIPMAITASEILLSDDYTRITFYGPNPKITHNFCGFRVECYPNELIIMFFEKNKAKVISAFHQVATYTYPCVEFLNFCEACNKKLKEDDAIYMHRAESSFCSWECLGVGVLAEEISKATDKSLSSFSANDEFVFLLDH